MKNLVYLGGVQLALALVFAVGCVDGTKEDTPSDKLPTGALDADIDTDTDTDTDADTDTDTDTDADTDTDTDSDTDTDTDTETEEPEACNVAADHDFGTCSTALGYIVRQGRCWNQWGCAENIDFEVFETPNACYAACNTPKEICEDSGAHWEAFIPMTSYRAYECGIQIADPVDTTGLVPGGACNCGYKQWDPELGCVEDTSCAQPACDDLGDIDFGSGSAKIGWAVRRGACQEVEGAHQPGYSLFISRDECNTACTTEQRLCMESDGAWVGDIDDGSPLDVETQYTCGEKIDGVPGAVPCNCGPGKNFVDGEGCKADETCVETNTCPDFDFDSDYTPSCSAVPLPGRFGIVNGVCSFIFGCIDDFEGPGAFIDPATYFPSRSACETQCSIRCQIDDDCNTGEYCAFEVDSNCGLHTGGGTCETSGGACIQVFDPVCGCNGYNISNAGCQGPSGVTMKYDGECFDFPALP